MVKLIAFLFIMGCATSSQNKIKFTNQMQKQLYKNQENFERVMSYRDSLYSELKKTQCLYKWPQAVEKLNDQLDKTTSQANLRSMWRALGLCYLLVGDNSIALHYFDLYLGTKIISTRQRANVLFNISNMYKEQKLPIVAKSYLRKALQLNPKHKLARYGTGLDELNSGNYLKAIAVFTKLSIENPDSLQLKYSLGISFFLAGDINSLRNKVLVKLDEKDKARVSFDIASRAFENKISKDQIEDFNDLKFSMGIMNRFKDIVKRKYGI